jgi:hypothetical protein
MKAHRFLAKIVAAAKALLGNRVAKAKWPTPKLKVTIPQSLQSDPTYAHKVGDQK